MADRPLTYSYRLRREIAMLSDEEFSVVWPPETIERIKRHREATGDSLPDAQAAVFAPGLVKYREFTGRDLSRAGDLPFARRSDYGPDCSDCGKPYRTPRAKYCAECGHGLEKLSS